MEEKIRELYSKIREMGASFVIYHKRSSVEQIKEIMPDIQEFVLWFLEGNRFGIEEQFYKDMSNNILVILEDIFEALKQGDIVLLHDATVNGLLEYLQLFMEQEEKSYDNI